MERTGHFGKLAKLESRKLFSFFPPFWPMSFVQHVNRLPVDLVCKAKSQIQSQAWRNLLNHLEKRKGGCVSISILLVFEISVLLRVVRGCCPRNDVWLSVRSSRWSTAHKTGNNETPLLILRPIMSQRRVVLSPSGYALGDFVSHPFRARAV